MAEKLVSMKIDPEAREARYKELATAPMGGEVYPYGLQLNLDEEALDKLEIDKLPKVESTIRIEARATVTSVSSNDSTHSGKRRSVSLQITHLCLEDGKAKKAAADVLYPDKE